MKGSAPEINIFLYCLLHIHAAGDIRLQNNKITFKIALKDKLMEDLPNVPPNDLPNETWLDLLIYILILYTNLILLSDLHLLI
jgi:hypothetical protein